MIDKLAAQDDMQQKTEKSDWTFRILPPGLAVLTETQTVAEEAPLGSSRSWRVARVHTTTQSWPEESCLSFANINQLRYYECMLIHKILYLILYHTTFSRSPC